MNENSIAHTKWNCKYHIVFIQKYRRKAIYEELKAMSPTNFEFTPIMTTSEGLEAREKNLGKIN